MISFPLTGTDWPEIQIAKLQGVTLVGVYRAKDDACIPAQDRNRVNLRKGDLLLTAQDGRAFVCTHERDCCEDVDLEEFTWTGTLPAVVRVAEEKSNHADRDGDSVTWSFFTLRCDTGDLDMAWRGSSSGYYSESPGIYEIPTDTKVPMDMAHWEAV